MREIRISIEELQKEIEEDSIIVSRGAISATIYDCGSYHRNHYPDVIEVTPSFTISDDIFTLALKMLRRERRKELREQELKRLHEIYNH